VAISWLKGSFFYIRVCCFLAVHQPLCLLQSSMMQVCLIGTYHSDEWSSSAYQCTDRWCLMHDGCLKQWQMLTT